MTALPPLTPGLISGIASWSWLDDTGFGPVAFLLLVHPEPAAGEALARAMRLSGPARRLPDIGDRVSVAGVARATVRLDGAEHLMQIPVGDRWADFVRAGGPVAVLVGLSPLSRRATRADVETYLAGATMAGRLRLGISHRDGSARARPPSGPSRAAGRISASCRCGVGARRHACGHD